MKYSDQCGESGDITTPVHVVWRDDGDGSEGKGSKAKALCPDHASVSLKSYIARVPIFYVYSLIHAAGLSGLSALCVCVYVCPCVLPFVIDLLMAMDAAHDWCPSIVNPLSTEFIHSWMLHPSLVHRSIWLGGYQVLFLKFLSYIILAYFWCFLFGFCLLVRPFNWFLNFPPNVFQRIIVYYCNGTDNFSPHGVLIMRKQQR